MSEERFGILPRDDERPGEILARIKREQEFQAKITKRLEKLEPRVGYGPEAVYHRLAILLTSIAGRELTEAEFGELDNIAWSLDDLDICSCCQRRMVEDCPKCGVPKQRATRDRT